MDAQRSSLRPPSSARRRGWTLLIAGCLVAWSATERTGRADPPRSPPETLRDAELTSVFFLDPERGWAVGDRGVIWRTEDGGRNWKLQESPLGCRWECVHFSDDRNGWIVGGWSTPYLHQSRGAVLRTRDGGQNWMPVPAPTMPRMKQVRFVDDRRGLAWGDSSSMYPSGVFHTADGGRSWAPIPQSLGASWQCGDLFTTIANAAATNRSPDAMGEGRSPGDDGRFGGDSRFGGDPRLGSDARFGSDARLAGDDGAPGVGGRPEQVGGPLRAVLADSSGRLARVADGQLVALEVPELNAAAVRAIRSTAPRNGWLVGRRGLVMRTDKSGLKWQPPSGTLPPLAAQFDWNAIAVVGSRIWIAGEPGSGVLHSADEGRTWQLQPTGQSLPLNSVCFLDENHGWAVGSLGTILLTRDGGRTWRRQQGGGRAAVLGVFAEAFDLPLDMIAQVSAGEGHLSVAEIAFRPSMSNAAPTHGWGTRVHAAMLAAGGSSAAVSDEFPLPRDGETPTAEQLVAEWDRLCGGDSLDRLEARLIRQIRQWRPEILVIDDLVRADGKPASEILYHVSLQAVQRAAEPDSRPEQLDPTMPEPWKVKKVFAALPAGERGTVNLTPAQLAPRVGRSLSDIAATGRAHLLDQFQPSPSLVGFRLILDLFPQELGRRDFLSGSMLQPGGDGRRAGTGGARADSAELNRSAQKQRNIQQLLLRSSNNPAQSAAWLAQLDELTRGIGKSAAGDLSWQLAQRYQQQGQHSLAAEMLQQLVKRDATHELSDAALVWLVQYYGSAEFAWRRERMAAAQNSDDVAVAAATGLNRFEIEPSAVAEAPSPAVAAAPTPTRSQSGLVGSGLVNSQLAPGSRAASSKKNIAQAGYVADDGDDARRAGSSQFGGGVARAGYVAPIAPMGAGASAGQAGASGPAALSGPVAPVVPADSAGAANLPNAVGASAAPPVVQLGEFIERTRPALATEPFLRFPLASSYRRAGRVREAEGLLRNMAAGRGGDAWTVSAQAELWLTQSQANSSTSRPSVRPARRTLFAPLDAPRPILDGQLDDETWEQAARVSLAPEVARNVDPDALAWVASDGEYLYLAAACRRLPGRDYATSDEPRSYDTDLSGRDRVEFVLDIDRDLATAYHLTIDYRGWTNDRLWNDVTWNPKWFVASHVDEEVWTVEAAIPLDQLAPRAPAPRDAWVFDARRIPPGRSAGRETSVPLEHARLVVFETAKGLKNRE